MDSCFGRVRLEQQGIGGGELLHNRSGLTKNIDVHFLTQDSARDPYKRKRNTLLT